MTLAERLTPYVNSRCNNWVDMLSSIKYSINQSVDTATGYSPHKIVYGYQPHFPLAGTKPPDFDSIPADARGYVRRHAEKMSVICTEVRNNAIKAQQSMIDSANENINPLQVSPDDYVYLSY